MDLRDLVKLAGIVNPELLNKIETTAEVEEAEGAGFEQATTAPDEQMMDDPMQSMGSDVDTSLRRYLKAKGDHVSVDETVYPDHTVESVSEAYASFKEGSAEDEKAIRRAFDKADEPERGEKRKKVSLKKFLTDPGIKYLIFLAYPLVWPIMWLLVKIKEDIVTMIIRIV